VALAIRVAAVLVMDGNDVQKLRLVRRKLIAHAIIMHIHHRKRVNKGWSRRPHGNDVFLINIVDANKPVNLYEYGAPQKQNGASTAP